MRLLFVKLGGSLITDKAMAETVRAVVLGRLCRELATFLGDASRETAVVVGHGSGSFGHMAARGTPLAESDGTGAPSPALRDAAAATQLAAGRLHLLVREALVVAGVPAFSVSPSAATVAGADGDDFVGVRALLGAVSAGMVPVVHGDVVATRAGGLRILSTEDVFLALCAALEEHALQPVGVLWLGETPGLHDADGARVERMERLEDVALGAPRGVDVTGGVALRARTVLAFRERGVGSLLADGRTPGRLVEGLERLAQGDWSSWCDATVCPPRS